MNLNSDGLLRKALQNDNLAPLSSDKIRAKILDLGYGGARTREDRTRDKDEDTGRIGRTCFDG